MAKTSSGAGLCVCVGWWSAYGAPLVAKSPELGFIPTPPPSKGGALGPLVVSSDLAHLRVWEVGWGNVPLFFAVFCAGVPSYFTGRGSLGAFPWFVPPTLECNTHSFIFPCNHELKIRYSRCAL